MTLTLVQTSNQGMPPAFTGSVSSISCSLGLPNTKAVASDHRTTCGIPRRTVHLRELHVLSRGSSPSGHRAKQYKVVRKRDWASQVICLLVTMRSSLFLLALAAANGVIASLLPSSDYFYRQTPELTTYINSLVPVAKDVLRNKIAGSALGAGIDVSPNHLLSCTSCARC